MIKEIINEYLTKFLTRRKLMLECFNEKSFQHNLGEYIKKKIGSKYIIQYERNVKYFNAFKNHTLLKSEADIVVLKKDSFKNNNYSKSTRCVVVEIKFIRRYSELNTTTGSPTSLLKEHFIDIAFCNELKTLSRSTEAVSLLLSDYKFRKPGKCKHQDLWNAYYSNKIDVGVLNGIKRIMKDNKVLSNTSKIKGASAKLNSGSWMSNFYWNKTKVGAFIDEYGHDSELKYILI